VRVRVVLAWYDRPWCGTLGIPVWFDRPWCGAPVVQVWYDRPWCELPVVLGVIVCCGWFQSVRGMPA